MKLIDYEKKTTRYDVTVELDNGQQVTFSVPTLNVIEIKLGAEAITKQQVINAINERLQSVPNGKQI